MIALLCSVGALTIFLYYFLIKPHSYWNRRGLLHDKPKFLLGHWDPVIYQKVCTCEFLKNIYDAHPNESAVPVYQLLTPTLIIRDPELIKQIIIKDFNSFFSHGFDCIATENDPLWGNNLFGVTDFKLWRDIRPILSPAYTKSKLKIMFDLINGRAQQFSKHFEDNLITTFEAKDSFSKVTNDIIATTAFGVECDSMKDPNNEMFKMGKELVLFNGGTFTLIQILLCYVNSIFAKVFKIRLLSEKITNFLMSVITSTIKHREENGIFRPDIIHLMIEARKGNLRDNDLTPVTAVDHKGYLLTDEVVTAQAAIFYFAGFDTISTASSFTVYELALNPYIQNRLFAEISSTFEECDGNITYEALLEMKYLDMVVSESIRKWCPFGYVDRKPTKSLTLSIDDQQVNIDPQVICYIPVFGLHRDPQYWPEPEKFDPERFSVENKAKIVPCTYLPFGAGPRNCIANRFAVLALKSILVNFLYKFEVVTTPKTAVPLKLAIPSFPDMLQADEYWLGLSPRKPS